ncbi:hypothetical protein NLI96_g2232 [Meripilus lineatus]|uniref:F-box domain-containing protein n=1 Tax=Meripilus lineatus TaxID=2056292 RepID=A0AAD5VDJ3_9APHY|nr:hypothetical protein NLI96_g2232 [Physisporinus lineatus]
MASTEGAHTSRYNLRGCYYHIVSIKVSLPLELVYHIAIFLTEDRDTLNAFSTACRSWREVVQPLIYHNITLFDSTRAKELSAKLEALPSMSYWVTDICLNLQHESIPVRFRPEWMYQFPITFEAKLPKLRHLGFGGFRSRDSHKIGLFLDGVAKFHSIREIHVFGCRMCPKKFLTLLQSLPLLDSLSIIRVKFDGDIPTVQHPPLRISSVTLNCIDQTVHAFIGDTVSSDTILSFKTHILTNVMATNTNQLLEKFGASLRELNLQFTVQPPTWTSYPYGDTLSNIDVSHSTGLQRVTFNQPESSAVFEMVSQLRSRDLRVISFIVEFESLSQFKNKDCKAIDQLLSNPNFTNLQQVLFLYKGPLEEDLVTRKICRVFPSVTERGILRIEMTNILVDSEDE